MTGNEEVIAAVCPRPAKRGEGEGEGPTTWSRHSRSDRSAAAPLPPAFGRRPLPASRGEAQIFRPRESLKADDVERDADVAGDPISSMRRSDDRKRGSSWQLFALAPRSGERVRERGPQLGAGIRVLIAASARIAKGR